MLTLSECKLPSIFITLWNIFSAILLILNDTVPGVGISHNLDGYTQFIVIHKLGTLLFQMMKFNIISYACIYDANGVHCPPQENLLDRHEFLKWLVEEEFIKVTDNKVLQLYLPLVLTVSQSNVYLNIV